MRTGTTREQVYMLGKHIHLHFDWSMQTMGFDEWRGMTVLPHTMLGEIRDGKDLIKELEDICWLIRPWIAGVLDMTLQEYIDKMGFREP